MAAKKNPQKADPMLGALAATFGVQKPGPAAEKTESGPIRSDEGGGESRAPEPPVAPSAPKPSPSRPSSVVPDACVKKTTVSFHEKEQDKVDLILDSLKRSRRHRGGFSDAIKIALRLCPLDDESIARAWDEARAQDQRVLRHKRNS
jgi:hypothetical protein